MVSGTGMRCVDHGWLLHQPQEATALCSCPPAGREFASGSKVKDMVTGAVAMAEFAHVVAAKYPVTWCYTPTTVRKTSSTTTSVR